MQVQPYLFFEGRAEEAVAFYQKALGAEVTMLMRYKDGPDGGNNSMLPPNSGEKIMHMSLKVGDAFVMGSDGHCSGKSNFQGFSLSLVTVCSSLGPIRPRPWLDPSDRPHASARAGWIG